MHKALNGKGYIQGGAGVFVTGTGDVYTYRDGELTPMAATDDPKGYAVLARGLFATT